MTKQEFRSAREMQDTTSVRSISAFIPLVRLLAQKAARDAFELKTGQAFVADRNLAEPGASRRPHEYGRDISDRTPTPKSRT